MKKYIFRILDLCRKILQVVGDLKVGIIDDQHRQRFIKDLEDIKKELAKIIEDLDNNIKTQKSPMILFYISSPLLLF